MAHQQHIRDAAGGLGLTGPCFLAPVLAMFVRALPMTCCDIGAPAGTRMGPTISGREGGRCAAGLGVRAGGGADERGAAEVTLDADMAWPLFTNGLMRERAVASTGDRQLGEKLLDAVGIIA